MKTNLFNKSRIAVVLLSAIVTLTSCPGDDKTNSGDDNPTINPTPTPMPSTIVGTWQLQDDEIIYNLKSSGWGYAEEFVYRNGKKIVTDEWPLSYIYDENKKSLTITEWFDSNDVTEYTVQSISATNLIVYNKSRQMTETYTKVSRNDIISNDNIVGTWRNSHGADGYELYIFNKDRSGIWQDWGTKNGREVMYDEIGITFAYSEENDKLTIVESDGTYYRYNILSFEGSRLVIQEKRNGKLYEAETLERQ